MSQSHPADQPMTLRGRGTERVQSQDIRKTIKVKQSALSPPPPPHQDDFKTRKGTKHCITKQGINTEPPQTRGATINTESTTTELPL